jgi:4-oxalocrotonate tautomerase
MPYILVQLVSGRTAEQKRAIAEDITASLTRHANARRDDCYVVFHDVEATDWVVAGQTVAERRKARNG